MYKDSHYKLENDYIPVTLLIIILETVANIREEKEIRGIKTRNWNLKRRKRQHEKQYNTFGKTRCFQ